MGIGIDPRDVGFLNAVGWSEQLLASIENGWEPPCTTRELDRVHTEAMHAALRDMKHSFPDPAEYARMLPPIFAEAIMTSTHGRTGGFWVDDSQLVPLLRSLGLISIRDRELTSFAMLVRRELRREDTPE